MTESLLPPSSEIEARVLATDDDRLDCAACQGRMYLVFIELDELGRERRTFECSRCDHVDHIIFEAAS